MSSKKTNALKVNLDITYQEEEKFFSNYRSYGGSTHGLWFIENKDYRDGGPLFKKCGEAKACRKWLLFNFK